MHFPLINTKYAQKRQSHLIQSSGEVTVLHLFSLVLGNIMTCLQLHATNTAH